MPTEPRAEPTGDLQASFAHALAAARAAAGSQAYPPGALYLVATPIGNLADIGLRALHVLQLADRLACEDTRHTQSLLRGLGIDRAGTRLIPLHQHNEREAAQTVLGHLGAGERVAFVSDAGTPGISDPGARLAAEARAAGHRVVPIPGASSLTTLMSAAAVVADTPDQAGFRFAGFLPHKGRERQSAVEALAREAGAVVLFESPHRIAALARALTPLGDRALTVGRELTKQFEQIETLRCADFEGWLGQDPNRLRGEFALVLHPAARPPDEREAEGERVLVLLLAELPLTRAARLAAEITGASRNALYAAGLRLQQDARADDGADEGDANG